MKREGQTPIDVIHETNSFVARRSWGRFRPGKPLYFFILGAEKALALEIAKDCCRARAFRPSRGTGLPRVILLTGGRTLPRSLLHHRHGMEGAASSGGGGRAEDKQMGVWRWEMRMR